jgi:cation diffusion facilitator family transporter
VGLVALWRILFLEDTRKKAGVALLSVASNTTLVLLKLVVGIMIGSVSVISEAIHSGVDLLAAIIAYAAVKVSGKPADEEHPFGHGKYENISGTVEALLIFVAALWIIYEAIKKLLPFLNPALQPEPLELPTMGIVVMLISVVANFFVSRMLFKVGKETDSRALEADAWHLQTDIYTSAGVMFGLLLIWVGKKLLPGVDLDWIDPVAAIAVAILIFRAAYHLTRESARDLLDTSLPSEEEEWIRDYLRSLTPTVKGFHGFKTRKSGSERFVELHALVSADMSVEESHKLTGQIKSAIRKHLAKVVVTIHVEPCDGGCTDDCKAGCLSPNDQRNSD